MKEKNSGLFLKTLNTVLLTVFVVLGIIFFIITTEDKKDNTPIDFYSIKENKKEDTMFKNELPKVFKEEQVTNIEHNDEDDFTTEDPELSYAIKLFESAVNSKLKTLFNKPFNYKEGSFCYLEVTMGENLYKIKSCNSDSIFRREIDLGIEKMKPFKRKTYNNINLKNKKITLKLKID